MRRKLVSLDLSLLMLLESRATNLLLAWKNCINIKVFCSNEWLVNCLVFQDLNCDPRELTLVYRPLVYSLKSIFLENLPKLDSSFDGEWLLVGDFIMILNRDDIIGGEPLYPLEEVVSKRV